MESTPSNTNATLPNNNEQELQFYDPTAVLSVSREVAFGYLILLTGGAVEYEAPTLEDVSSKKQQQQSKNEPQSPTSQQKEQPPQNQTADTTTNKEQTISAKSSTPTCTLDEESASLAFSAIVDGNVLHPCFGLKATANGRVSNAPTIIGDKQNKHPSLFCCFPTSPGTLDALQLVLPHLTVNKLRMQNLVEVLREVKELHYDVVGTGVGVDLSVVPLYMRVIQAYVKCFTAIVRYHDTRKYFKNDSTSKGGEKSKPDGVIICCSNLFSRWNRLFFKNKSNPQLEKLQQDTLQDIKNGFRGVREEIWESLERMATETAFTGVSVEE